ncbi:MAG: GAF domain-containing protein, partial [Anaerolineales bacterium]|nr:GAF domain-containing protein [Anaerolineales bacterium]
ALAAPPSLIISDVLMPIMDGFSLCRRWMQEHTLRRIPFVFYTATYTDERDIDLALNLGAVRFITKPAEPPVLLREIQKVAESHPTTNPEIGIDEEPVFLKNYNERLVHKLEEKILELKQANERLKYLYQASVHLNTIQPSPQLLASALQAIVEALGYTYANYFNYDAETGLFHLIESVGYAKEEVQRLSQDLVFKLGDPQGLVGLVGQTKQLLILGETGADSRWLPLDSTSRSALYVPLTHNEELLGVISILSRTPEAFTEEDSINAQTLANNLALVLRNAELSDLQRQKMDSLEDMVAKRTVELKVALENAEQATRLKTHFVSDMNHELRTPLSNVKLYLQLMEFGNPENRSRYLETLNRETDRLQKMIEELLDLSRLELGKTTVDPVPLNVNQLVGELIVDRVELAHEKGLSLDFHPQPEGTEALVDPQLFYQVLTNLLANAVNYTPSGGSIWLETATAVADRQRWVTISIIDNGPGISEEDLPHLFDRFYRGQAARESGAPGTGLGLAICQEIMQRHEGKITVESIPGMGSKFTMWLKAST